MLISIKSSDCQKVSLPGQPTLKQFCEFDHFHVCFLTLDPESVKVPEHEVYLGPDCARRPGGQPVPLPPAGHQVSVLEGVTPA